MIDGQDSKINYKIILTALCIVVIGILIAFYYSNAQSNSEINFLEQENDLLTKNFTMIKADVDRLTALNEVNDIELQSSKYKVQQLSDSIGRLNFTITKLREFKTELRRLEAKVDSFKLKNNFLKYNNTLLTKKYKDIKNKIDDLKAKSSSLAEAEVLQRKNAQELQRELKIKDYLKINDSEGDGFRLRGGKVVMTNKASVIEKLRGCITISQDPSSINEEKVIYFQFLGPTMGVIENNANIISVNGNIYSKRVELVFNNDSQMKVCDFITIPEGSLLEGKYTLNVFEDEKLLSTTEFILK